MSGTRAIRPYRWLALYYDRLFTFHLSWFEAARRRVLGPLLPGLKSACDLACGTGTTALRLAARGIRVFAVDLSPDMCRNARRKARRLVQGYAEHYSNVRLNSAIGYITPKDMLAGRQQEIHAGHDRSLALSGAESRLPDGRLLGQSRRTRNLHPDGFR